MTLLIVITLLILLSEYVYTQNCASSVLPPDSKSGCCGLAVGGDKTSGSIARIDEYPWMGIVEYQKKNKLVLLCSAILISGRHVLSAGSCFSEQALKIAMTTPVNIRLGDYDLNNDGPDCIETAGNKDCNGGAVSIPIEKFTVHPEYNNKNSKQNDIALIRLATLAPYTDFIRPICLPSLDITLKAPKNLYMTVAGWGAVNVSVSRSNVLRRVHVPYVDFYICRHKYNETVRINLTNGQLCAGSKNRDSCSGDSGGPLMLLKGTTTELAGIVSFGPSPCGQEIPGVYTKVYAYNDWIKATIEAEELISTSTKSLMKNPTTKSTNQDFYSDLIVFKD